MSPWLESFEAFARSIRQSALLVSPFIGSMPLQTLNSILPRDRLAQIEILTNLSVTNLVEGSTSAHAIADFCRWLPITKVRHLPGLHAKVYIADERQAIVTSANLTEGGLRRNYEYGIVLTEPALVASIARDLRSYGELGIAISLAQVDELARISEDLQTRRSQLVESATQTLRHEFQSRVEAATETLRELRARPGESTNSIFARTILYLLRRDPLTTREIHPLVQSIHPDLCDDTIDRVINGVHFGKRWKHMVRNAQQSLKSQGLICFDGRRWQLI